MRVMTLGRLAALPQEFTPREVDLGPSRRPVPGALAPVHTRRGIRGVGALEDLSSGIGIGAIGLIVGGAVGFALGAAVVAWVVAR